MFFKINLPIILYFAYVAFLALSEGRKNTVIDLIKGKKASRSDILHTFRNYYKYNYYMTLEEKIAVEIIGQSAENKDIYMIIITDNALDIRLKPLNVPLATNSTRFGNSTQVPRRENTVIFIDAALHAREWVAPAAAFYVIDKVLESPHLTSTMEWRIVPMANPDGYEFTHDVRRYWRKNRGSTSSPRCVGVDLNRNFDFLFQRTNALPCSEVYGGEYPFSEPETRAIRDAVSHVANRTEAYISLHAFGQLILYPNGITKEASEKLLKMARAISYRIELYHYSNYRVSETFVPGASSEWAFSHMKIPYSFTFELQPHSIRLLGSSGFQLSNWKLLGAVHECWTAVQYLAEDILLEKSLRTGLDLNEQYSVLQETEESNLIEWEDIAKEIKHIRANSNKYDKLCNKKGNLYDCPLMIFWNSEFESIFGT